jgi:hypothetical protein
MALASFQEARSPVELSLSPVYQYQYSSIAKVLDNLSPDERSHSAVQEIIQGVCMGYFQPQEFSNIYLLQTDTTPVCKPHSPTLKERTHVAVPNNVIRGNKPLNIGYEVSFVNLSDIKSRWSLPLAIKRVDVKETASECALGQLKSLFAHSQLGFSEKLIINTLDSKYGTAHFLAPAHQHDNLVNIARLRAGMKVWKRDYRLRTGGAPGIYGEKYYLLSQSRYKTYKHPKTKAPLEVFQRSILELEADETWQFDAQTTKGRKLIVQVWRYNDMMIRSKDGNDMKDKPFNLLVVRVTDAQTGKIVFDREMFLAICGERRSEIASEQGYQYYRRRYDIESSLRFSKQRLLLEKYQTSDTAHFDNWLLTHQLTHWLLYTASKETNFRCRKWEQYLPESKQAQNAEQLSISQTRKGAQELFLTFDPAPFKPVKCKKGNGREKGQTQTPRKRYKVVKKSTKKTKTKLETEPSE